uniref:Ubiquitin-like protease family profile domain-containing protein n=1 Tax=Oryza rufipogon TaxID=4529 RepID=A0A0E0NDB3_ORYRU
MAGERRKPLVVRDGRRIRSYSPRSAGGMGPRPHPLLFAKIQLTKKEDPFITYFNKTKDNKVMVHIEEVKVNRKSMKVLTEPEYLNDDIFLPTNITEIHWYLAILNAKRREVQILDSLAKPISEHRPRTRACASRVAYTPLSSWSIGADLISQKIKYRQLQ